VNMKIHRLVGLLLCLSALVLTTAAFRSCSAEEKRSVSQNVTSGLSVAARAVEPGLDTVRAFREAGKVEPATSLSLARGALDANSAAWRFTKAALDGSDSVTLAEQLDTVVRLASDLERDGTLHLKNGDTKLVFQLGVLAAKNGLVIAQGELKGSGTPRPFTLDDATRQKLGELLPVFERNDRLLREAITGLAPK
jgi:hypothetical protein